MTKRATTPPANVSPFCLTAEVARLYQYFPKELEFVSFIDVVTQEVFAPSAGTRRHITKLLQEPVRPIVTLEDILRIETLSEKVAFHAQNKSNAAVRASGTHAILLYLKDDQQRYLGTTSPLIFEQAFNLDHETAHVISRYGDSYNRSFIVRESFADCYAALRHWQRFGTETGAIENLSLERLKHAMFKNDIEHFTSPALEQLIRMRNDFDLDKLSPAETVRIAIEAAKYAPHSVYIQHIEDVLFKPLKEIDRHGPDFIPRIAQKLSEIVLTTKTPDIFNWGSIVLSRLLNRAAFDSAEWQKTREELKRKRAEYEQAPALYGLPARKKKMANASTAFNRSALLLVDIERKYCDPLAGEYGTVETDAVTKKIKRATQSFRRSGGLVVFIHTSHTPQFHRVTPQENDILYKKKTESAWEKSDKDIQRHIDSLLRRHSVDSVLVAGFNASSCVKETAQDARKHGFDVITLTDLCANDKGLGSWHETAEESFKSMEKSGIRCVTFAQYRKNAQAGDRRHG